MTLLSFRNEKDPDRLISAKEVSFFGINATNLTKEFEEEIKSYKTYFSTTNNLVIRLDLAEGETEDTATRFKTFDDGNVKVFATALWKVKKTPELSGGRGRTGDGTYLSYESFTLDSTTTVLSDEGDISTVSSPSSSPETVDLVDFDLSSISNNDRVLEIELKEDLINQVDERFTELGIERPEFGILLISVSFVKPGSVSIEETEGGSLRATDRVYNKIFAIKYTHNPLFAIPPVSKPAPTEPIVLKFRSLPHTFETLYIPHLTCSFVYNFFEINETNYDLYNSYNFEGRPLSTIPKYIELTWRQSPVSINFDALFRQETGTLAPPPDEGDRGELIPGESTEGLTGGMFSDGVYLGGTTTEAIAGAILSSDRTTEDSIRTFDTPRLSPSAGALSPTGGSTALDELDLSEATDLLDESAVRPGSTEDVRRKRIEDVQEARTAVSGYIGYVIEKERIDEEGNVSKEDLYVITDPKRNRFIDWKIAYGETYRYRIRSVFKFVNKNNLTMYQDSDATIDREGSSQFFDGGILFSKAYYFDSEFSDPCTIETFEFVAPDPPYIVKIQPNSTKKNILISWNQKQQNKDILGYNIYKKKVGETNFKKLNNRLIGVRNNFFIDNDVKEDIEYIYAVETVDVHFNISKLSAQYISKISYQNIQLTRRCEFERVLHAPPGLSKNEQPKNKRSDKTKILKKARITINPLFKNLDQNSVYLLKILSLDTLEEKELKINFTTRTINHISEQLRVSDKTREEIKRALEIDVSDTPDLPIP